VICAFLVIGLVFICFVLVPMKKILQNQGKSLASHKYKILEIVPAVHTSKNVSVRLELKRRGSWPVAYSNKYAYNYNK